MLIIAAVDSKACTAFHHSDIEINGLNPTVGLDVSTKYLNRTLILN
jgi:hypothetical protein